MKTIGLSHNNTRPKLAQCRAFFVISLTIAVVQSAGAQDISLAWGRANEPISLGSGIAVSPGHLQPRNQSLVVSNKFKWQNLRSNFELDSSDTVASSMQSLKVNAWAEASSLFANGKFSFDWASRSTRNTNHRRWRITAFREQTAFLPTPTLLSESKAQSADLTAFAFTYGNYAVTQATYRRQITIDFDAELQSRFDSSAYTAAVSGSYFTVSGGGSVSQAFSDFASKNRVTIDITVYGENGSKVITAAVGEDLIKLRDQCAQTLKDWSAPILDPNEAGDVVNILVKPYSGIDPAIALVASKSPDEVKIRTALDYYIRLKNQYTRLQEIQRDDTYLNAISLRYLFGKKDSAGNHIPNTGKLDEVTNALRDEYDYLRRVTSGNFSTADPAKVVDFEDPDVLTWTVRDAWIYTPQFERPTGITLMVTSARRFVPHLDGASARWGVPGYPGTNGDDWRWGTSYQIWKGNPTGDPQFEPGIYTPELSHQKAYVDPKTGYLTQFFSMEWEVYYSLIGEMGLKYKSASLTFCDESGLPYQNCYEKIGQNPRVFAPFALISDWRYIP